MTARHPDNTETGPGGYAFVRPLLLALGLAEFVVGAWQLLGPHSFYSSFPGGRGWVADLGPYNEHLMTDVGELTLALAVVMTLAGIFLGRRLVQVALISYLTQAVPHLAFHAVHREHMSTGDNVANLGALGLAVVVPTVLLYSMRGATWRWTVSKLKR
jgi:hypothetical protein